MKPVRIFVKYEDGTYEKLNLPYEKDSFLRAIQLLQVVNRVFERETGEEEFPLMYNVNVDSLEHDSTKLTLYMMENADNQQKARMIFFRRIALEFIDDDLPTPLDVLDSDINYLINLFNLKRKI